MKNQLTVLRNLSPRHLLLFTCTLFLLNTANGQYELVSQDYTSDNGVAPRTIGSDAQGNIFVAGWFNSFITLGSFTLDNASGATAGFIGKYDVAIGDWVWVKKITNINVGFSFATSYIEDLAVDAQGNVYFTGLFRCVIQIDNVQLTSTRQGQTYTNDILLVKLSPSGSVIWAKGIGTKSGADNANAIALDGANNIYIGGTFGNTSNCFYTYDQKNEIYLAKLNNAGVVLWQKRYIASNATCNNTCTVTNLALDAAGSILITGAYQGSVSFGTGSSMTISSVNNSVDPFAAKINNSGTTQWVKGIASTTGHEPAYGVCVDASGNGYFGGPYTPVGYINKYSPTGTQNWSVDPFQFPVSRLLPLNGSSILALNSRVGFKTIDASTGAVTNSDSLVGNTFDPETSTGSFHLRDVVPYSSGYIFLATGRCGSVTLDNLVLTCNDTCEGPEATDIFLVRTTSLPLYAAPDRETQFESDDEFVKSNVDFNIYPNPVQDELRIEFRSALTSVRWIIHDQFGKEIWSGEGEEMHSMSLPLDENRFASGIYYFTAISEGEVQTRRFIVAK